MSGSLTIAEAAEDPEVGESPARGHRRRGLPAVTDTGNIAASRRGPGDAGIDRAERRPTIGTGCSRLLPTRRAAFGSIRIAASALDAANFGHQDEGPSMTVKAAISGQQGPWPDILGASAGGETSRRAASQAHPVAAWRAGFERPVPSARLEGRRGPRARKRGRR